MRRSLTVTQSGLGTLRVIPVQRRFLVTLGGRARAATEDWARLSAIGLEAGLRAERPRFVGRCFEPPHERRSERRVEACLALEPEDVPTILRALDQDWAQGCGITSMPPGRYLVYTSENPTPARELFPAIAALGRQLRQDGRQHGPPQGPLSIELPTYEWYALNPTLCPPGRSTVRSLYMRTATATPFVTNGPRT